MNKKVTTIKDWIDLMVAQNAVCPEGVRRLAYCSTKTDVFRVLCDSFSSEWLHEMMLKGIPLPLDQFAKEYAAFVNGNRVMEYGEKGYTSKIYVKYKDLVVADTTIVSLLDCQCGVEIPKNKFPRIIVSPHSKVAITMGIGSRLALDVFGDAYYTISGDNSKVRITKH